jgi:molybdate transport system substrate-binding protein
MGSASRGTRAAGLERRLAFERQSATMAPMVWARGSWIVAVALSWSVRVSAADLHVFAAASLSDALSALAPRFEQTAGVRLVLNLAGSNDLARQIRAGAPADVFFSADTTQMDLLVAAGDVARADIVALLSNTLVVVVPARSHARVAQPQELLGFTRLALADPEAVPAGVYARQWLQGLGLWERLQPRVVPLLNVRAALQAVAAENAPAGIVYRTDAALSSAVRVAFEVPPTSGPTITYVAAALAHTPRAGLARAFVQHLRGPDAARVFASQGFGVLRGQ